MADRQRSDGPGMGLIAFTLLISAPMQLAAAAGVELSGGYDSTVLNPNSLVYDDGGIARAAVDVQLAHQTDTVRQLLRNRSEFLYTGGEGRALLDSDFLNITRYALQWEPGDDWRLNADGLFIYGRTSELLTQGGATDLAFLPGIYADYSGHLALSHDFSDTWRGVASGGVIGRSAVSIPPSEARENTLSFWGQLTTSHNLSDSDVGSLTFRAERFLIDGFPDWVNHFTGYAGWSRSWSENTVTQLNLGVDALQDQNSVDTTGGYQLGPYINAGITQVVPDAHMVFGAVYRHEYTMVSAGHCAVPVYVTSANPVGVCPPGQTGAGGTGLIDAVALSAIWHPDPRWYVVAEAQGELGTTVNTVTDVVGNSSDRVVPYKTFTASLGVRWRVTDPMFLFARYDFLYEYTDPSSVAAPIGVPPAVAAIIEQAYALDVVRHVVMVGVEFVLSSGDAPLEGIIPLEEINAVQDARMAGDLNAHAATLAADHASATQTVSDNPDEAIPGDPFDLSEHTAEAPLPRAALPPSGPSSVTPGNNSAPDTGAVGGSQGDSSQ